MFHSSAYELLKNVYKEIFLDRPRDYYFLIFSRKAAKNKSQSPKQNKIIETYLENIVAIDFHVSHLTNITHKRVHVCFQGKTQMGMIVIVIYPVRNVLAFTVEGRHVVRQRPDKNKKPNVAKPAKENCCHGGFWISRTPFQFTVYINQWLHFSMS